MRLPSLRSKIILAIIVVGSLPLLLGYLLIFLKGTDELRHSLGESFQGLAHETASKTDLLMERELRDLRQLAAAPEVRQAVGRIHTAPRGRSPAEIRRPPAAGSRGPQAIRQARDRIVFNTTAALLRQHLSEEMAPEPGRLIVFATDARGVVMAATTAPPAARYRGADWWEAAWRAGAAKAGRTFLSNAYYDDRIKSLAFRVAVPILDLRQARPIGLLAAEYDVKAFFRSPIHTIRFGRTGHAMLIDGEGVVLICPILPTGAHISDLPLVRAVTSATPGWVLAANDAHGGMDSIVGFAPTPAVNTVAALSGTKPWHTFIRQDPKEAYTPIRTLLVGGGLAGGVLLGVLVVLGLIVSGPLTRSIRRLREHAELVGQGHLDRTLTVKTGDEIQALAEAFNQMAHRLKESYATLEQRVADRTRELATLHKVVLTVNESLDLQRVLNTVLDQVVTAMRIDAVAIRLWDPDQEQLLYRAARGFPDEYLREREAVGPAGTVSGQAFLSGQPIVIARVQEDARVNPSMKRLGVQAMAAVPIKSKDKALGSLSVATLSPRAFTEPDVALLISIGAQIGATIEHADLYARAQAAMEQLREADRLKSQFLSSVSHELRTPLTSIIGFTELLLDEVGGTLNPDQVHHLQGLKTGSDHLMQMVNGLLDLARLRAGKLELRRLRCRVPTIVQEAEQTIRPLVAQKQQRLTTQVETDLPALHADASKLRQVLLNLLGNAVKFTPSGGLIRLEARAGALNGQPAVEFTVSDTGIGIRPEDMPRIFDEFYQVSLGRTTDRPGTGLGLAISKRLVELHDGQVRVVSEPGRGSTFTVAIPAGLPVASLRPTATLRTPNDSVAGGPQAGSSP